MKLLSTKDEKVINKASKYRKTDIHMKLLRIFWGKFIKIPRNDKHSGKKVRESTISPVMNRNTTCREYFRKGCLTGSRRVFLAWISICSLSFSLSPCLASTNLLMAFHHLVGRVRHGFHQLWNRVTGIGVPFHFIPSSSRFLSFIPALLINQGTLYPLLSRVSLSPFISLCSCTRACRAIRTRIEVIANPLVIIYVYYLRSNG